MKLKLSQIAAWSAGSLYGSADGWVHSVSTDTRSLASGALYVALHGAQVDGHSLLPQAQAAGATAALVSRRVDSELPQIVVADVERALGALARHWLAGQPARRLALTGSCGKTSVKNLTAGILAQLAPTLATSGNLNNEIGLPLSALRVRAEHRYAVLELGAGKPGDIAYLSEIAQPQIALVNNALSAHLERLGSVRGVAEEKAQIYAGLGGDGVAVIPADDPYAALFRERAGAARVLDFALEASAALRASALQVGQDCRFMLDSPFGRGEVYLPLAGRHNVHNALAAAGLAFAAGATLAQVQSGLALASPGPGRLRLSPQPAGWTLVDDSYNANPGSFKAGIDTIAALPGEPWVVMGDMAELGPQTHALHREVGAHAAQAGIRRLLTVGPKSAEAADAAGAIATHFASVEQLVAALQAELHSDVVLLIKGSRSSAMERVVHALTLHAEAH